jgi:hypothetical protein
MAAMQASFLRFGSAFAPIVEGQSVRAIHACLPGLFRKPATPDLRSLAASNLAMSRRKLDG